MEMSTFQAMTRETRAMSAIICFGLDLAKTSFSICGVDAAERLVLRNGVQRSELLIFFSQQKPAVMAGRAMGNPRGKAAIKLHHLRRALLISAINDQRIGGLIVWILRAMMSAVASLILLRRSLLDAR